MSKMDDLRAMREARYAQRTAVAAKPAAAPKKTERAAPQPAAAGRPAVAEPELQDDALCGHRAISGRTCTREQGHAAKSHRYS